MTKERTMHQLRLPQSLARLMRRSDHLAGPSGVSIGGMPVIRPCQFHGVEELRVTLKLTCKNGHHSTNVGTSC